MSSMTSKFSQRLSIAADIALMTHEINSCVTKQYPHLTEDEVKNQLSMDDLLELQRVMRLTCNSLPKLI